MNRPVGLTPPTSLLIPTGSQRRQSLALRRAETIDQNDTFCVMPPKMRCLCLILTGLLMLSLLSAIVNSMQTSATHSESYCRSGKKPFSAEFLCPPESIVFYYECCEVDTCCARPKIWMIVAAINLLVSVMVCAFYLTKYLCTL